MDENRKWGSLVLTGKSLGKSHWISIGANKPIAGQEKLIITCYKDLHSSKFKNSLVFRMAAPLIFDLATYLSCFKPSESGLDSPVGAN